MTSVQAGVNGQVEGHTAEGSCSLFAFVRVQSIWSQVIVYDDILIPTVAMNEIVIMIWPS